MTDRELHRLSRRDLLELLITQEQENRKLRGELARAQAALEDRTITVAQAGTMAEAAMRLNGVFEAADRAAQQYLDNLRFSKEGMCHGE